ncbi:hypothetical protein DM450_0140 (plasmid) [Sphingomonas sp. IC081]|nr:hypothetical protein DM450_0140 [Sphingomonas sp. IC081]
MANYASHELAASPPPRDHDNLRQIALHIPREHFAFLEEVTHPNRGINLGIVLEAVGTYVNEVTPSPLQLSLAELWESGDAL